MHCHYMNQLFCFQTISILPENAEDIFSKSYISNHNYISKLGFRIKWYLKYTPVTQTSGTAKDRRRVFFGTAIMSYTF